MKKLYDNPTDIATAPDSPFERFLAHAAAIGRARRRRRQVIDAIKLAAMLAAAAAAGACAAWWLIPGAPSV